MELSETKVEEIEIEANEMAHKSSVEFENNYDVSIKENLPNSEKIKGSVFTSETQRETVFKQELVSNMVTSAKDISSSSAIATDPFYSEAEIFTNITENIRHMPTSTRHAFLPWGTPARISAMSSFPLNFTDSPIVSESVIRPGEIVMKNLITDFTLQAEKKIELVMVESPDKNLAKLLQRGEDQQFDQLLSTLGSMAEHCLPSLLHTLLAWHQRQLSDNEIKYELKRLDKYVMTKINADTDVQLQRRESAVEFLFCLALIEILKQLPFHPGHEDIIKNIENLAFKHFKYRDGLQNNPNANNVHMIADLYAEVIGVLAQSRFTCVRKRFMYELKDLRAKESTPFTTQSIISLLMGMKFFRVKMVPIEEFEASFQFMHECGQYFLEVRDKDIKHALAGLFVEILVPVAAAVKNEVNVPCVKNFVDLLYMQTLDASTKSKHRLALFPLVTCLLCVSQKTFFLANWHYFLAMCLSNLKNRDSKMSRVALESLYRLLWVYMIRIKCESNSATHSRLQSIVNSLFPKGSKVVIPRDTPLNIFVKIIQFIAQERLDFAMREIVYDLLCVGRPFKLILNPERMSIGLRAFLVVADSLQQKDGEPPMPRTVGVLPSGNTLRVKKTYINKMLTDDTARSIGMSAYFPHVRRVFVDILRALDTHYGRPLMMTNTHNQNKEPDEMLTGERKPRIDLFRTCVAAVPRLIPDTMTSQELVDLLSRLTVHMDEELRLLTYQSLQTLVIDFPSWRQDVIHGYTQFLVRDVIDTYPQLLENCSRMLFVFLNIWRCALNNVNNSVSGSNTKTSTNVNVLNPANGRETINSNISCINNPKNSEVNTVSSGASTITSSGVSSITQATVINLTETSRKHETPLVTTLHFVEGFALVLLCYCRPFLRKLAAMILKEVKNLMRALNIQETEPPLVDVIDKFLPQILDKILPHFPQAERTSILNANTIDLQWISERTSGVWFAGLNDDSSKSSTLTSNASQSSSPQHQFDPWTCCLQGFMERERVLQQCPSVIVQAWPICYLRVTNLYNIIDPTPINDNRASLLRSSAPTKKVQTEGQKDLYFRLWRNQIILAMRLIPQIPAMSMRCVSPDLSLSSSPDSLNADRSDKSSIGTASPQSLYKLIVPLLRCEVIDVKDAIVNALGMINHDALKDLMEELLIYIREAIDRKQENVRRRRRRDALRLQLVKVFEIIAQNGTFGASSFVLDRDTMSLHPTFVEYIEGARLYLESDLDKDNPSIKEVKYHFCNFIRKMIKNFSLETCITLLSRDLKMNLFNLFATWSGMFAKSLGLSPQTGIFADEEKLQYSALQAMSALLCCGPIFHVTYLSDEGIIYKWLDSLLLSKDEKIYQLGRDTVILLLDSNPDVGLLLEWVIDRCYTSSPKEADACFLALSTIFSLREYPCDHYTSVINVTLLMTGCPRVEIHSAALQLLQILDKRFFGAIASIHIEQEYEKSGTLDVLLSNTYCHSQRFLATQIAQLRPELTMSMFSEITHRFQSAREEVRALLLQCLLPWLQNMELIATTVPPATPLSYIMYFPDSGTRGRREGTGSTEATEMILNNLFYITVKFSDLHPRDIEELWGTLCQFWPNNLKVILRHLVIMSGMAPGNLLPYSKRVALYLARTCAVRLLDELMLELQTVETLNCLIERTETPPFYRLTNMRKASSHSDGQVAGMNEPRIQDLTVEKGTIHTKRHSGEDQIKIGMNKLDSGIRGLNKSIRGSKEKDKNRQDPGPSTMPHSADILIHDAEEENLELNLDTSTAPHPLPMPEYGGFFAPLTEFLPDANLPISGFHRCNVAVMLLCDIVVDGIPGIDWTLHLPLLLHILFLGIDHSRAIVRDHCKQLCVNLLIVLAEHNDHLTVARILLNSTTIKLDLGLPVPSLAVFDKTYTEQDQEINQCLLGSVSNPSALLQQSMYPSQLQFNSNMYEQLEPPLNISDELPQTAGSTKQTTNIIKSLIQFLSLNNHQPLWNYEDITAKVWAIKSAEQMASFLKDIVKVFSDSYPQARIAERWAQTALQLGLSCSSRHYAGRCLQIFRALNVPINSRMLSDILSRLVETVAEQGEDMQGYVTELLLTLEAAVDSLDSDFRPLDVMKDIFKSTPNLNNKENCHSSISATKKPLPNALSKSSNFQVQGHARSTSYSLSYCARKSSSSPSEKQIELRNRNTGNEVDRTTTKFGPVLLRSRSAQSLKMLGDTAIQEDKMAILSQLFWLSVSLLESDYEHEFLLALRLLGRVLHRLPLDRPDARDKVEKLQQQLKWTGYPGVHALVLKGCTHTTTYEPTVTLLSELTPLLNLPVCDPTQSCAFPMNVISVLPYMLLHYEDANDVCIRSAENIAQVSSELGTKLENLGTVMTLYSRKTFCKESFQWTKCVVKYLYDTYAYMGLHMLAFLTEVLEKAPQQIHVPVLNIIHSLLHYVDLSGSQAQNINTDLLKTVGKHLDTPNWKESLKILKLIVTRSSSLQIVPPIESASGGLSLNFYGASSDSDIISKKELAGRTMEFSFDVSQTPLIGRRIVMKTDEQPLQGTPLSGLQQTKNGHGNAPHQSYISTPNSPKRSASLSPADSVPLSGWRRPWMSQGRVRECLINLLTACGQRVGLPKSPSVIFSQSSDLMERQSSVASSTEETSGPQGDLSSGSRRDDGQPDFTVFKDFDFLEYEDSIAGESTDNFNWGVRRHPLFEGSNEIAICKSNTNLDESYSEKTPILNKRRTQGADESSDEEAESESPIDDDHRQSFSKSTFHIIPPQSLNLRERHRRNSISHSDTSGSSAGDLGDITPCNTSPRLPLLIRFSAPIRDEAEECWRKQLQATLINQPSASISDILFKLHKIIKELTLKSITVTKEAKRFLTGIGTQLGCQITKFTDLLIYKADPPLIWVNNSHSATQSLLEKLRFNVLEMQEHLETFFDRKDQVMECLDSIKASCKFSFFTEHGDQSSVENTIASNCISFDGPTAEIALDLGRALYKLLFQLLLLIEAYHKIASNIVVNFRHDEKMLDLSELYISVREALLNYVKESEQEILDTSTSVECERTSIHSPASTMTNVEFEIKLFEMIEGRKWQDAISHIHQYRSYSNLSVSTSNLWILPSLNLDNRSKYDDAQILLNIYSHKILKDHSDAFIVSKDSSELSEVYAILSENLYHASCALTSMEMNVKSFSGISTVSFRDGSDL